LRSAGGLSGVAKFKRLPIEIEAEQYLSYRKNTHVVNNPLDNPMEIGVSFVHTARGWVHIRHGDYIVIEQNGDRSVWSKHAFEYAHMKAL
jgi:hypothetical protein